jgi:hypothetical protein
MEHFKDDVLLSDPEHGTYQLVFKGVSYRPTDNPTAAGVLLFGLRPKGIKFTCKRSPEKFMSLAQHAAHILHLHANGDKVKLDGHRRIAPTDLREWVNAAVALAPDEHNSEIARKLINENLGPYAYDD